MEFFEIPIKVLKFIRLWMPHKQNTFYKIGSAVTFSMALFSAVIIYFMTRGGTNFTESIEGLNIGFTNLNAFLRFVFFFYHRDKLLLFLKIATMPMPKYRAIAGFDPEDIYRKELEVTRLIPKGVLVLVMGELIYALIYCFSVLFFFSNKYTVHNSIGNSTGYSYHQSLPIYPWNPWDTTTSKLSYGVAMICQWFLATLTGLILLGSDCLLVSMINFMCCHIKIMRGAFRTVRQRTYLRLGLTYQPVLRETEELNKELLKEINIIIAESQVIFKLHDLTEGIFSIIALVELGLILLIVCTSLYVLATIPLTFDSYFMDFIYFCAVECQLGLYCYFGNRITHLASQISFDIYSGDWLSTNKTYKSHMLIAMVRFQKPMYLTVGKFIPLTLGVFVSITKTSYSLLALLKSAEN